MNQTKNIAIFFGGRSTEYGVSLQSAYAVISAIDTNAYTPILIGLDRNTGAWLWYRGSADAILNDFWQSNGDCIPVHPSMDQRVHGLYYMEDNIQNVISLDAALPILHGKNGEDGTIQGVLALMGVPVIGCGVLSSALCMDKELAHQIARANGIKAARSFVLHEDFSEEEARRQAMSLGYPLFVKPVRSGSSFGISKISEEAQLLCAIRHAFTHDSTVILEETIDGFEIGCAILGTNRLIVGEVDEIELSDGFFDYTEKYTLKTSRIHARARIPEKKAEEIKETAKKLYRLMGCSHFARVDMFLTPNGEIYFNEINTIPGFTSHSRFPNMLKAAGYSFEEIIGRLLSAEE